jgi:hypothetical protein
MRWDLFLTQFLWRDLLRSASKNIILLMFVGGIFFCPGSGTMPSKENLVRILKGDGGQRGILDILALESQKSTLIKHCLFFRRTFVAAMRNVGMVSPSKRNYLLRVLLLLSTLSPNPRAMEVQHQVGVVSAILVGFQSGRPVAHPPLHEPIRDELEKPTPLRNIAEALVCQEHRPRVDSKGLAPSSWQRLLGKFVWSPVAGSAFGWTSPEHLRLQGGTPSLICNIQLRLVFPVPAPVRVDFQRHFAVSLSYLVIFTVSLHIDSNRIRRSQSPKQSD